MPCTVPNHLTAEKHYGFFPPLGGDKKKKSIEKMNVQRFNFN